MRMKTGLWWLLEPMVSRNMGMESGLWWLLESIVTRYMRIKSGLWWPLEPIHCIQYMRMKSGLWWPLEPMVTRYNVIISISVIGYSTFRDPEGGFLQPKMRIFGGKKILQALWENCHDIFGIKFNLKRLVLFVLCLLSGKLTIF
jgi:hypothetical protein